MRKAALFFGLASAVGFTIAACGDDDDSWIPKNDAGTDGAVDAAKDAPSSDACVSDASVPRVDCTATNANCPDIEPSGENLSPDGSVGTSFRGAADPSMRQDPTSQRIWFTYTWPNVVTANGADGGPQSYFVTETHLAYSDNAGQSFEFEKGVNPMFGATISNPPDASATVGGSSSASLVRGELNGGALWYVARTAYRVDPGPAKPIAGVIGVSTATDPTGFSGQNRNLETNLGLTHGGPQAVNVSLDGIAGGALDDCTDVIDPATFFDSGKLYVGMQCISNAGKDRIVIFSTVPDGAPQTWGWRYVGLLADAQTTKDLVAQLHLDPSVSSLSQVDFARGRDGKLIAVVSPTKTGGTLRFGCAAIEMTSIDPPAFARGGCDNHLLVRAVATASDDTAGTGACAYEPSSSTGLVLTRGAAGDAGFSVHKTVLIP